MGLKVLSLFDGMSCGQLALQRLGIEVDTYYASEIDKYAIQVTQANFPKTIQVGDVCELKAEDYQEVDLILAGSPCQGFSFAGKQLAFDDPRSALFFEFIRLLKEIKPKYFLLENVKMKQQFQDVITEQVSACYPEFEGGDLFGGQIKPILINSALLSAQNRQRLYWTNIPNIEQPKDKGIVLRDILEDNPGNKYSLSVAKVDRVLNSPRGKGFFYNKDSEKIGTLVAGYHKEPTDASYIETKPKQVGIATDIKGHDILKRVYSPDGKSPTLNTMGGGNREPKVVSGAWRGRYKEDGTTEQKLELNQSGKSNSLTTVQKDSVVVNEELSWRKLTPLECERLQTVPDNYTNHVSNTQRYKMLGNGWTIEVIAHILNNMEL